MRLGKYLEETDQSITAFTAKVRARGVEITDVSMGRYCNGHRTPRSKALLKAIQEETGGRVTPNDFFEAQAAD